MRPGARITPRQATKFHSVIDVFRTGSRFLPLCFGSMNAADSQDWLASPLGSALLEAEQRLLADALADVFGFELLQIGIWGDDGSLCSGARTQHRRLIAPRAMGPRAVRADFAALPIATASVEAVLLPHTLEYAPQPHDLLREVERILTGEGHLIVCGFNPLGPWGLRHLVSHGRFPSTGERMLSERRLCDWLRLLGLEVTDSRPYLFAPPWNRLFTARTSRWLEQHAARFASPLSAAYLVKARKRVRAVTPIRPAWQRTPAVVGGIAEPTSRNAA
jgi:SAM-dependent methyltransferase